MPHLLIKSLKVGLLVILPLILTSITSNEENSNEMVFSEGSYMLNVRGKCDLKLEGIINFETVIKRSSQGKEYNTLKLNLTDGQKSPGHSLGFVLSKHNNSSKDLKGRHKITRNIEGFLNYFDGTFGFANINQLGETPFYKKNGVITIDNIDKEIIKGNMNVVFENLNKNNIEISGHFIAFRK